MWVLILKAPDESEWSADESIEAVNHKALEVCL